MLQDIRKHTQGTTAKVIIGLIVISFGIFGIFPNEMESAVPSLCSSQPLFGSS